MCCEKGCNDRALGLKSGVEGEEYVNLVLPVVSYRMQILARPVWNEHIRHIV